LPGNTQLFYAPELGHLTLNQQMGLLFMDFDTAYLTGTAEMVWREDKTLLIKGVGRVIWVFLKRGRFVHLVTEQSQQPTI